MSDKKLPKIKHNHTLTDILKASIFSLVMMAPIAAIGITCAYVVCNKNAYQSYSDNSITSIKQVNNGIAFIENQTYIAQYDADNNTGAITIAFSEASIDFETIFSVAQVDAIALYPSGTAYTYYWNGTSYVNNSGKQNYWGVDLTSFQFIWYRQDHAVNNVLNQGCTQFYIINLQTNKLDNVFYYAVDTMQNNTLFSWTKTTAIYTPVNAMTTGMGINTPAIAVLLVYWLLCTAVYIIIDIVVKGFTWLTHLIGER